jgi:hypothetical protein
MKYSYSLAFVCFVAACATSEGATEEGAGDVDTPNAAPNAGSTNAADVGQTDQAASGEFSIPEPYVTTGGSSTASVMTSLAGAGLQLDGGFEPASYVVASYPVITGAMRVTAEFTVNAAPGASFTYLLRGTGGGYSSRYVRVQRVPGSDALQAVGTNGAVACGALVSGQPTPVTLVFDGAARTLDVRIAGAATPCTGVPTRTAGPVTGLRVNDETLEGYGGHVELTNLSLSPSP